MILCILTSDLNLKIEPQLQANQNQQFKSVKIMFYSLKELLRLKLLEFSTIAISYNQLFEVIVISRILPQNRLKLYKQKKIN